MNNSLILCSKPKVSLNVSALFRSPSLAGLWERSRIWMLNAGLSAAFFDERLIMDFKADDILELGIPYQKMRLDTQWINSDSNFYGRSFTFKISYKFKGYKDFKSRTPNTERIGIQ